MIGGSHRDVGVAYLTAVGSSDSGLRVQVLSPTQVDTDNHFGQGVTDHSSHYGYLDDYLAGYLDGYLDGYLNL